MFKSLELHNVRKFSQINIVFPDADKVFITGPNGSGKTTTLESLIFLSNGFLYGNSVKNFLKEGEKYALIRLKTKHPIHLIEAKLSGDTNTFYLNSKKASREAISEIVRFFWFFPQDILLILGGDEERRGFLDRIIKETYPAARKIFSDYNYFLKIRNEFLKGSFFHQDKTGFTLDSIEEMLAKLGSEIIKKRNDIAKIFSEKLEGLSEEVLKMKGSIRYKPSLKTSGDFYADLVDCLYVSRETDARMGATSVGPHRDSVKIIISGRDSRFEASYGERKLLALLMKIAGKLIIEEISGKQSIFLADDLFGELDKYKKDMAYSVLNELCEKYIATSVENDILSRNASVGLIKLENGGLNFERSF